MDRAILNLSLVGSDEIRDLQVILYAFADTPTILKENFAPVHVKREKMKTSFTALSQARPHFFSRTFTHAHTHTHTHTHVHTFVFVYICVYLLCDHVRVHVSIFSCVYVRLCMHLFLSVCNYNRN